MGPRDIKNPKTPYDWTWRAAKLLRKHGAAASRSEIEEAAEAVYNALALQADELDGYREIRAVRLGLKKRLSVAHELLAKADEESDFAIAAAAILEKRIIDEGAETPPAEIIVETSRWGKRRITHHSNWLHALRTTNGILRQSSEDIEKWGTTADIISLRLAAVDLVVERYEIFGRADLWAQLSGEEKDLVIAAIRPHPVVYFEPKPMSPAEVSIPAKGDGYHIPFARRIAQFILYLVNRKRVGKEEAYEMARNWHIDLTPLRRTLG